MKPGALIIDASGFHNIQSVNDRIKIYTNIKPFLQESGAPTKRISPRNLTSKASWGWALNKEDYNVNSTSLTPLLD